MTPRLSRYAASPDFCKVSAIFPLLPLLLTILIILGSLYHLQNAASIVTRTSFWPTFFSFQADPTWYTFCILLAEHANCSLDTSLPSSSHYYSKDGNAAPPARNYMATLHSLESRKERKILQLETSCRKSPTSVCSQPAVNTYTSLRHFITIYLYYLLAYILAQIYLTLRFIHGHSFPQPQHISTAITNCTHIPIIDSSSCTSTPYFPHMISAQSRKTFAHLDSWFLIAFTFDFLISCQVTLFISSYTLSHTLAQLCITLNPPMRLSSSPEKIIIYSYLP